MKRGPCLCATETYCKGLCMSCYKAERYKIKMANRPRARRPPGPPVCHPDRKHEANGLCETCYQRAKRAAHPEVVSRYNKTWRQKHPEKARAAIRRANLFKKFGITIEQYDAMLQEQGGVCALCERPERTLAKRLAVDHNHHTGRVRGLLCGPCNVVLGYIENADWFNGAIDYLSKHEREGAA